MLKYIGYYLDLNWLHCRKLRSYKRPLPENVMTQMSYKTFSDETMKKVNWVRNMYADWRNFRNNDPNLQNVKCDIENLGSFPKKSSVKVCVNS